MWSRQGLLPVSMRLWEGAPHPCSVPGVGQLKGEEHSRNQEANRATAIYAETECVGPTERAVGGFRQAQGPWDAAL